MSIISSSLHEGEQPGLCAEDYPLDFKDGQHPDDYVETDQPIAPACIFHHFRGKFNRLWWRASWKLKNGKFMAMSFLLDTGAPKHLYLCNRAMAILERDGQLTEDGDMDMLFTELFGRKCPVESTPIARQPANIIGLKLLKRFGLTLYEDHPHFSFSMNIPYLDAAAVSVPKP